MKKSLAGIIITALILTIISSCYYDSQEEIYPLLSQTACDTTNATYSAKVSQIISKNCLGCHNAATAQAGIVLETYNDVKTYADNGLLVQSITGTAGKTLMPYNGNKLSDCDIAIIDKWVNDKSPL